MISKKNSFLFEESLRISVRSIEFISIVIRIRIIVSIKRIRNSFDRFAFAVWSVLIMIFDFLISTNKISVIYFFPNSYSVDIFDSKTFRDILLVSSNARTELIISILSFFRDHIFHDNEWRLTYINVLVNRTSNDVDTDDDYDES